MLSIMTRDILILLVSTIFFDSAFSTGGRIFDSLISWLIKDILDCCMYGKDWHDVFLKDGVTNKHKLFSDIEDDVELFVNIDAD